MQLELKPSLLSSFSLGELPLGNRVVMASMTRGRAQNADLVPTSLHVEYYRQRASAGLIVTEATWVNNQAIGSINVPGLFNTAQVDAWRRVTEAVHADGGRIYVQIGHSGAVSHPDLLDGSLPVAPSAVNPYLQSFTSRGFRDTVTPRAMTLTEIDQTVADYAKASRMRDKRASTAWNFTLRTPICCRNSLVLHSIYDAIDMAVAPKTDHALSLRS
jgi:N-ethylmaleimide reductase